MSYKKLRAVQEEARTLIRDSIVEDAISRFIAQILEVAAQRNTDRIEALEAEVDRLRAEVERLREAERTAWERGRDAAAAFCEGNAIQSVAADATPTPTGDVCWTHEGTKYAAAIRALTPETSHD